MRNPAGRVSSKKTLRRAGKWKTLSERLASERDEKKLGEK